jgi:hypothetical protein
MEEQAKNQTQSSGQYEHIDSDELGKRLGVPGTWVREQTRRRGRESKDPLPVLRIGRYCVFRWNSPELNAWISRRLDLGGKR